MQEAHVHIHVHVYVHVLESIDMQEIHVHMHVHMHVYMHVHVLESRYAGSTCTQACTSNNTQYAGERKLVALLAYVETELIARYST